MINFFIGLCILSCLRRQSLQLKSNQKAKFFTCRTFLFLFFHIYTLWRINIRTLRIYHVDCWTAWKIEWIWEMHPTNLKTSKTVLCHISLWFFACDNMYGSRITDNPKSKFLLKYYNFHFVKMYPTPSTERRDDNFWILTGIK